MRKIFRSIWFNTPVREGVLMVVSAMAIAAAVQGLALASILEDSVTPVDDFRTWLSSFLIAISVTGLKQASAFVLARLAGTKLAVSPPPVDEQPAPTPPPAPPPTPLSPQ